MVKKNIWKKLTIFIFIMFLPFITEAFVFSTFKTQLFLSTIFSSILISSPYFLFNNLFFKKIYWNSIGFLIIIWSLVESIYLFKDKVKFNELAIRLFLESFPKEILGFFSNVIPIEISVLGLLTILILLFYFFNLKHEYLKLPKTFRFVMVLFIFLYILFVGLSPKNKFTYLGVFENSIQAVINANQYFKSIDKDSEAINKEISLLNLEPDTLAHTWVLLIGESSSRHHWELYGYPRPTNPKLKNRKDIILYDDVISSHTSTVESLSRCLTFNSNGDLKHDFSDLTIADIANASDIKTWWISTHHEHGLIKSSVPHAMKRCKHVYFLENDFPGSSMPHDGLILPYLSNALKDTTPRKLILIHLMGSHLPYKDRYPRDFEIFGESNFEKKKYRFADTKEKINNINAYDNSHLYQDFVLNEILNQLDSARHKGSPVSAIYFSDHGEEVYDYRNFLGHSPQSNSAWMHDIPFFTWGIPNSSNQFKPYNLKDFFHTLVDWMGIHANKFNPQNSIINNSFSIKNRFLGNGQKYTKKHLAHLKR